MRIETMPHTCIFGCNNPGPLHRFPNPEKLPERFKTWYETVYKIIGMLSKTEVQTKRICDIHFLPEHKTRFNRLCNTAMPLLHLPGFISRSQNIASEQPSQSTTTAINIDYIPKKDILWSHEDHPYCSKETEPNKSVKHDNWNAGGNINIKIDLGTSQNNKDKTQIDPETLEQMKATYNDSKDFDMSLFEDNSSKIKIFPLQNNMDPLQYDMDPLQNDMDALGITEAPFNEIEVCTDEDGIECFYDYVEPLVEQESDVDEKRKPSLFDAYIKAGVHIDTTRDLPKTVDSTPPKLDAPDQINTYNDAIKPANAAVEMIKQNEIGGTNPTCTAKCFISPRITSIAKVLACTWQKKYTKYKKLVHRREIARKKRQVKYTREMCFEKVSARMSPLCKQFMWEQVTQSFRSKKSDNRGKGLRFPDDIKDLALAIMKESIRCYRILQEIFILPSYKTLQKRFMEIKAAELLKANLQIITSQENVEISENLISPENFGFYNPVYPGESYNPDDSVNLCNPVIAQNSDNTVNPVNSDNPINSDNSAFSEGLAIPANTEKQSAADTKPTPIKELLERLKQVMASKKKKKKKKVIHNPEQGIQVKRIKKKRIIVEGNPQLLQGPPIKRIRKKAVGVSKKPALIESSQQLTLGGVKRQEIIFEKYSASLKTNPELYAGLREERVIVENNPISVKSKPQKTYSGIKRKRVNLENKPTSMGSHSLDAPENEIPKYSPIKARVRKNMPPNSHLIQPNRSSDQPNRNVFQTNRTFHQQNKHLDPSKRHFDQQNQYEQTNSQHFYVESNRPDQPSGTGLDMPSIEPSIPMVQSALSHDRFKPHLITREVTSEEEEVSASVENLLRFNMIPYNFATDPRYNIDELN